MQLILSNNHVLASHEGNRYVVDTGSPVSFNYRGLPVLELGGARYGFGGRAVCAEEDLAFLTGVGVDGLIGLDILKQSGLFLDFENMRVEFSPGGGAAAGDRYRTVSFSFFMGTYLITDDLFLGRRLNRAIIDTGAPVSYVSSDIAAMLEPTGETYEDHSPEFGRLSGEYRAGELVFGSGESECRRPVRVGRMPDLLDAFGLFDAIVGVTELTDKQAAFDFDRHTIRIKL